MSRICIIGNSHVGAFKDALTNAPLGLANGAEVTLFGSHSSTLANSEITADGILRPKNKRVKDMFAWTSGGQSEVTLRDYDVIYIALGRSFFDIRPFWVNGSFGAPAVVPPMSDTLLQRLIDAIMMRWDLTLARQLSEVPGAPEVVFLGAPFVSDEQPDAKALLGRLATDPDGSEARRVRRIRTALDEAEKALSTLRLRLVRPPAEALEPLGLFTRQSFAIGSQKLSDIAPGKHSNVDFGHMNGAYGRLVLEKLMGLTFNEPASSDRCEMGSTELPKRRFLPRFGQKGA